MAKILLWPDLYREQGHWLPAVNLAETLVRNGHTPEFMGIVDCKSILDPYAGTFHPILEKLYPLGHTVNDNLEPIGQRWKPHHLMPLARGVPELDALFNGAAPPELLIAGYFVGLEALILHYRYGVPLVTLTTYLRHPSEDPAIFAKGKLVYMEKPIARKIIDTATANLPASERPATFDEFIRPLELAKEMIPCAREFDFYDDDWKHEKNVEYVEPMIERRRIPDSGPPTYPPNNTFQNTTGDPEDGRDDIYHWLPDPSSEKKIIFATAGSQVADYEDKAREFFKGLIAMMKTEGMTNRHLVLSVGDKLLEEFRIDYGIKKDPFNNKLPQNVSIAAWVSQLRILDQAEVVFMHGGLASIKEAIWGEVPIVIIPHGKDQMENALRIKRTGVGVVPDTEVLTPQAMRKLMTKATTSKWVRNSLTKMRNVFAEYEGLSQPKPSLTIINDALSSS